MKIDRPDLVIFLISEKSLNYGDFLQMVSEKLTRKKQLLLRIAYRNMTFLSLVKYSLCIP